METKICSKCKRELPVTEFYNNKVTKDGLQSHCKECSNEYRKSRAKKKNGLATLNKVYSSPELAKFTPRQLMEELKSRGFKWDYMIEPQRKIMFEKI